MIVCGFMDSGAYSFMEQAQDVVRSSACHWSTVGTVLPILKTSWSILDYTPPSLDCLCQEELQKTSPYHRTHFSCIPMQKFLQLGMSIKETNENWKLSPELDFKLLYRMGSLEMNEKMGRIWLFNLNHCFLKFELMHHVIAFVKNKGNN
jgi:hypothetical protein